MMVDSLATGFGIGRRELVSIVGAGGKTTILHTLGNELARHGSKVVLTTTTRMAADQVTEPVCLSTVPRDVDAALLPATPLFVMSDVSTDKAAGIEPGDVDLLYGGTSIDYLLVEADGARSKSIKAPAEHEPVIPSRSTLVVVVLGADALGEPLIDVGHRPERIAELTGSTLDAVVTAELAATLLLHPEGGLKDVPDDARFVIAITKVSTDNQDAAIQLVTALKEDRRVDRVVTMPPGGGSITETA